MSLVFKFPFLASFKRKKTSESFDELIRLAYGHPASASGVTVSESSALRQAAVFSCVRVLCSSIAPLPLHLYKKTRDGREKASDHPLYDVLNLNPNEFQSSFEFWEMVVAHLQLRGNFFAHINRLGGRIVELNPLHPDKVSVKQLDDLSLQYQVKLEGSTRFLSQGEVFHVKGQSMDGVVGLNPIAYMRESIGLAIATERHGAQLFKNGAKPGLAILREDQLSQQAVTKLETSFNAAYGGENSHKTMVLDEGMKVQPLSMTAEDCQFLETRKFQRSEVAGMFQCPPHKIGDLEHATYSNVEHQEKQFVIDSLQPITRRIEQAICKQLLSKREQKNYYPEFLFDFRLKGDTETRFAAYEKAIFSGILSPNEARAKENENVRPDGFGDNYYHPLNMVVSGQEPEVLESLDAK